MRTFEEEAGLNFRYTFEKFAEIADLCANLLLVRAFMGRT
jgi:hypothetical protein